MVKGANADKKRRKLYRRLIKVANEVFSMATAACSMRLIQTIWLLRHCWENCRIFWNWRPQRFSMWARRILNNEKVPASDKIVSLFEDHTDIICRGKSDSPTEFGHKSILAREKAVWSPSMRYCKAIRAITNFFPECWRNTKSSMGRAPSKFSADRRYFSAANEAEAYKEGVKQVSICKPGYQSEARRKTEKTPWFKKLQKFRAGIEGIISGLMRGLGLKRCSWKGFTAFRNVMSA